MHTLASYSSPDEVHTMHPVEHIWLCATHSMARCPSAGAHLWQLGSSSNRVSLSPCHTFLPAQQQPQPPRNRVMGQLEGHGTLTLGAGLLDLPLLLP